MGASPRQATGQPSCNSSRTSSPHFRIASNQRRAMAPNSLLCCSIQASRAGSRSTAPLNRRKSVFIVARLERERETFYTENTESAEDTEKKKRIPRFARDDNCWRWCERWRKGAATSGRFGFFQGFG